MKKPPSTTSKHPYLDSFGMTSSEKSRDKIPKS
jgi:hypothetical protein